MLPPLQTIVLSLCWTSLSNSKRSSKYVSRVIFFLCCWLYKKLESVNWGARSKIVIGLLGPRETASPWCIYGRITETWNDIFRFHHWLSFGTIKTLYQVDNKPIRWRKQRQCLLEHLLLLTRISLSKQNLGQCNVKMLWTRYGTTSPNFFHTFTGQSSDHA